MTHRTALDRTRCIADAVAAVSDIVGTLATSLAVGAEQRQLDPEGCHCLWCLARDWALVTMNTIDRGMDHMADDDPPPGQTPIPPAFTDSD